MYMLLCQVCSERLVIDLIVKVGDVFLSSAIGSKFPSGYPVGRVTHVEKQEHNPFLTIELTPSQLAVW
jgi:rod shape-determining protein MreC